MVALTTLAQQIEPPTLDFNSRDLGSGCGEDSGMAGGISMDQIIPPRTSGIANRRASSNLSQDSIHRLC